MTDQRRTLFLRTLAETGSPSAAAAAASPHCAGRSDGDRRDAGLSSFRDLRKRDPVFAQQWQEAEGEALGRIEAELARRSITPDSRPVVVNGEVVGVEERWHAANALLLRRAVALAPERWSERKAVEHSGTVEHEHRHAVAVLSPEDVMLLESDEDREQLLALLGRIAERKAQRENNDGPRRLGATVASGR